MVGGHALVYDAGAGTFDTAVILRTRDGFELRARQRLSDAGGLDVDAAVVAHLGRTFRAKDAARWQRLISPNTDADRRAARQLRNDVQVAKEMLSKPSGRLRPGRRRFRRGRQGCAGVRHRDAGVGNLGAGHRRAGGAGEIDPGGGGC